MFFFCFTQSPLSFFTFSFLSLFFPPPPPAISLSLGMFTLIMSVSSLCPRGKEKLNFLLHLLSVCRSSPLGHCALLSRVALAFSFPSRAIPLPLTLCNMTQGFYLTLSSLSYWLPALVLRCPPRGFRLLFTSRSVYQLADLACCPSAHLPQSGNADGVGLFNLSHERCAGCLGLRPPTAQLPPPVLWRSNHRGEETGTAGHPALPA